MIYQPWKETTMNNNNTIRVPVAGLWIEKGRQAELAGDIDEAVVFYDLAAARARVDTGLSAKYLQTAAACLTRIEDGVA